MEDKINRRWRTSSYSGNGGGNCVEVAAGGRVLVRDSQDRAGTVLRFPPAAWREFADQVKRSLALDPALRVYHSARFTGAARTLVFRPLPIYAVRTAVVFGEARTGLRGRLEPAVVSSAGPGFPRACFQI
jgi:long-subunit acyl-CoA synthetase (AMP-forming)